VAFRDCEDLAFDLEQDPDEQINLLKDADAALAEELSKLRPAALKNFSFDTAEEMRKRQVAQLQEKYPAQVQCRTPNQILRGDGKLVEADGALYEPEVVSDNMDQDFQF
jgi:hypothetical protein